jgi:hypothetical protein
MPRFRYYQYEFERPTGERVIRGFTRIEAIKFMADNDVVMIRDGYDRYINAAPSGAGRKKDGFQVGFNPGLGEYVTGRRHQRELLKQKGLEEVGNEKVELNKYVGKDDKYFTDEVIKDVIDRGGELKDSEINKLKEK